VRLGVPFIPVPSGFGNVFTQVFGHRDGVDTVLALLRAGEIRSVDVGIVGEEELFLSHRSYGFLERIQQAAERVERPRSRWRRHLIYYAMARRALLARRRPSITVDVDGVRIAEGAVLVTVANVETYRGFLSLTPAASPIDGLFDVFIIPRVGRLRLVVRLLKLLLRMPGRWNGVLLCRGRRVSVRVNGKRHEELRTLRRARSSSVSSRPTRPWRWWAALSPDRRAAECPEPDCRAANSAPLVGPPNSCIGPAESPPTRSSGCPVQRA
jgi:diacylglycerol kinase family enzyme